METKTVTNEWPIGATVVTIEDLGGTISNAHFEGDVLVQPQYGVVVPAGTRGKVVDHFEDGRILCDFPGHNGGHSFREPGTFLRLVEDWDGGKPLSEIEDFDVRDEGIVSRTVRFYEDSYTVVTTNANWTHVLDCDGEELFSIGGNPGDDELKRLLQVYHTGLNNGRKWGKAQAQSEIRKALGL